MRADLAVRQPLRRQGNDEIVNSGQPPLPFGDDFRLEAGIAVPRHGDLHRPSLGEHILRAVAVAGIPAIAPGRVVLAIAEVIIELPLQGAFDHHLGQLPQQPALTGQLQPARAGPLGKLTQYLLIGSRQLHRHLALAGRHVIHWRLLRLGSYTVEVTVPIEAKVHGGIGWSHGYGVDVVQLAHGSALGGVHGFTPALTSFVGRAAQVDEVAGLLAEYRLVTVTGPGGVGKSRAGRRGGAAGG